MSDALKKQKWNGAWATIQTMERWQFASIILFRGVNHPTPDAMLKNEPLKI